MNMKKNRSKVIVWLGISLIAIVAIAFTLKNNKRANEEKMAVVSDVSTSVMVHTGLVSKEVINPEYTVNGNFSAYRQVDFSSEVSGRVLERLVDEGDYVKSGQVLAVIKSDAIGVDLENAQAVYNNALKDKERFENAFKSGGVTQQQLDQIKLALKNAESRLEQVKLRDSDTKIKSTISGFVNKRYIEQGAFVGMGTPLFEIVDISKLNLNVSVNEMQVAKLKLGDKVEVKASAFPNKKFSGKIKFIAVKADQSLNFPVEIELANNPDNSLKAGMYGTAIFRLESSENIEPVLFVPRSVFVGSVSSGEVYVIKDHKTILTKVVPGRIFGEKVEIINGLAEGETVVTGGQINLQDGVEVSIVK
jgi:RND family efflux transporter MFP subunit